MPLTYLFAALGLLLAISGAANAALWHSRNLALERIGAAQAERDGALASAKACSDATERLREAERERAKAVQAALREAAEQARADEREVRATLAASPSRPDDLCASALALSRAKAGTRVGKPR